MKKTSSVVWAAGAVVVLVAALGLGLGIKKIRLWRSEAASKPEVKPAAKQIESETAAPAAVVEAVEEEPVVVVEEAAEEVEAEAEEIAEEEPNEVGESESVASEAPMGGGFGGWRGIWADLNLTEEEMGRLRQGFALAMQKWQNMSEEEREAEMGRLRGMRARWENMSEEEREGTMQRMRGRFEEWRESGQVELPEISLD